MIIEMNEWQPFDGDRGAILEAIMRKTENGPKKSHSVIIWTVTNPSHSQHGRVFIIEPQRTLSTFERLQQKIYNTIEEAKPDAERMFQEYLDKVRSGEINWWSHKVKGAE